MLSKAQNKYIRSLSQQKYREEHGVFVVEGDKIALEWLRSSAKVHMIVALQGWIGQHQSIIARHPEATLIDAEEHHLHAISNLQTPNNVLLVVHKPTAESVPVINDWCLALDNIQDPGNMGTILRIADWFGIKHVLASQGSVDYYNPKVVQSAMGAHLRVALHTADLQQMLSSTKLPVYAAVLNGENIYNLTEPVKGFILIGNESQGIAEELQKLATHKLTIPRIGGAESLNAGVSAGIICALLIKA
jgi:TrmH family RNA methyltransferase